MSHYLILCRSVTYARRTAAALARSGIAAHTLRAPQPITTEGCGYCVRVKGHDIAAALDVLRSGDLAPKHIFASLPDGGYREVTDDLP